MGKTFLAVGAMSGTSMDGCSVALASFTDSNFKLIDCRTFPYPASVSRLFENALELKTAQISQLHFEIGESFAASILKLLKANGTNADRVSVIGSHGQTVYHGPNDRPANTMQLGESSIIAERTGITVVSDFRPRDMAAGGEGAPLIPFFDQYFWGSGAPVALQNIGGISNVTVVGRAIKNPIAFDNGPGNALIDWAIQKISDGRKRFDAGGAWAAKGVADQKLLLKMMAHPYFRKHPPKSTGKELFNERFLPKEFHLLLRTRPHDALRTLVDLTAESIAESYRRFIFPKARLSKVIVSGGGAFNRTLMRELSFRLSPLSVVSIEQDGLSAQAKEPVAFAFFGLRALQGKANHLPAGTGARGERILGKITPGKKIGGIL